MKKRLDQHLVKAYRERLEFSNYNIKQIEPHANWVIPTYTLGIVVVIVMSLLVIFSTNIDRDMAQYEQVNATLTLILVVVTLLYAFSSLSSFFAQKMHQIHSHQAILAPKATNNGISIENFGSGPAFDVEVRIKSPDDDLVLEEPSIGPGEAVVIPHQNIADSDFQSNDVEFKTRCLYFQFSFSDRNHYFIKYDRFFAEEWFKRKNDTKYRSLHTATPSLGL